MEKRDYHLRAACIIRASSLSLSLSHPYTLLAWTARHLVASREKKEEPAPRCVARKPEKSQFHLVVPLYALAKKGARAYDSWVQSDGDDDEFSANARVLAALAIFSAQQHSSREFTVLRSSDYPSRCNILGQRVYRVADFLCWCFMMA